MKTLFASILICVVSLHCNSIKAQCMPDLTDPVCMTQDINVYLDNSGMATIAASDVDNGSFDDCTVVMTSIDVSSFDCDNVGDNTVILTVEDEAGNTSTCSSTVNVQDTIAPMCISGTGFVDLFIDISVPLPARFVDEGSTDNCDENLEFTITPSAFSCDDVGLNDVVFTATDDFGNTCTSDGVVLVREFIRPTCVVQDVTLEIGSSGTVVATTDTIDNGTFDPCGILIDMTVTPNTFDCSNLGANSVTFMVSDTSGNTCSATAEVFVISNFVCSTIDQVVTLDADGNGSIAVADVDDGSTNPCGMTSLSLSQSTFNCDDIANSPIEIFLINNAGTVTPDSCPVMVTVQDDLAPICVIQDVTVYVDAAGVATVDSAAIDNGSSDNCGDFTMDIDVTDYTCSNLGDNTVNVTLSDGTNETMCSSTVTVLDTVAPVCMVQDITVFLDGSGNTTVTAADVDNESTDNCPDLSLELSMTSFDCTNLGNEMVLLTLEDGSMNSIDCPVTITVVDTVAPVCSVQDLTLSLDANGMAMIDSAAVDNGSSDNCDVLLLALSQNSFSCADVGLNMVTVTVTDGSGNTSECISNVTIQDDSDPICMIQDVTIYIDENGTATIDSAAIDIGSSDNCDEFTLSIDNTSFECDGTGDNTINVTVSDGLNSVMCSATITVLDTISPTCMANDVTVFLDETGNISLTTSQVDDGSTDNCSELTQSLSNSTFDCSNLGDEPISLILDDNKGNIENCPVIVTVQDTFPPVCLVQDITVSLDESGVAAIDSADIDNGSTDNCDILFLALSQNSFTCEDIGINMVTVTVTDGSGNTSECVSNVSIQDDIAPICVIQDVTIYLDAMGVAAVDSAAIDNGSSDNCGDFTLSIDVTNFTCAEVGDNTINVTLDDGVNSTMCTSTVTVLDTISPICEVQDIDVYLDDTGNVIIDDSSFDIGSGDNCGIVLASVNPSAADCTHIGSVMVSYILEDEAGNMSTCMIEVMVQDTTSPACMVQDITVSLDDNGIATIDSSLVDNGSSDNCGMITLELSQTAFTCANVGDNTVTVTVTDSEGNTSECESIVTVEDDAEPICNIQDVTIYLDAMGVATVDSAAIDNGSSDNCGEFTLSIDVTDYSCAELGDNTINVTLDDGLNTTMCTSTVTVLDTISPICAVQDISVFLDDTGNVSIDQSSIDVGSDDNCEITTAIVNPTMFDCSNIGDVLVEYTLEDESGNSTICTVTVAVADTTAPVCVFNNLEITLDSMGVASIDSSMVDGGSSDNCVAFTLDIDQTDFTCADAGVNEITVTVTDASGNSKEGSIEVVVTALAIPQMVCPADMTVDCTTDFSDPSVFGMPEIVTTCGGVIEIVETVVDSLNECGIGIFVRKFVATETGSINGIDSCTQRITTINPSPLTVVDISFPDAVLVDACSASVDITGETTVDMTGLECSSIFVTFVDDTINDICPIVIDRAWTVVDSCALPLGIFEYTQAITVQDTTKPILICPSDMVIDPQDGECEGFTELIATATDNCAIVNITNDSPFALEAEGDASGTYPLGTTTVTFTATDSCGNQSICAVDVTVNNIVDLSCELGDLILQFPTSNMNEVVVIDSSDLDLTVNTCLDITAITLSQNTFSCDEMNQEITVVVTDSEGNTTECSASVIITSSCENFNDETVTPIILNSSETEIDILPGWSTSCASAGYTEGGNGFSQDSLYLEVVNEACVNGSYIYTNSLFNGNLGVYNNEVVICFDVSIVAGENTSGLPLELLTIYNGISPATSTSSATFVPTIVQTLADGYQTYRAPLALSVAGSPPSNSDGSWVMNGMGDWDELISGVQSIGFALDAVEGVETFGFDNICIQNIDPKPPVVLCPEDLEIFCYEADDTEFGTVETGENCMMEYTIDTVTIANLDACSTGSIERTLTVIDELGNSTVCIQSIELLPPPEQFLAPPVDVNIFLDDDQCSEIVPIPAALITDFACSDIIDFTTIVDDITIDGNGGTTELPAGKFIATFIGVDECGNESTVTSQVNLLRPCDLFVHTQLNLSVNDECEGEVTAAMVATFPVVCDNYYDLFLIDEAGDTLPSNFVDYQHIGQNITFVLTEPNCGNKAWGNILVEDKLAPELVCFADTISCGELIAFQEPTILDACSNSTLVLIDEEMENVACDDEFIEAIITRNYIAIDASGNESEACAQRLYIRKFDISTIEAPTFKIELECGETYPTDDNGAPDPLFYGGPTVEGNDIFADQGDECNLITIFEDKEISTPEADLIVREFSTFYWSCSVDTVVQFIQVFKFVDTNGPAITCPVDITLASNADMCSADYVFPALNADDICGEVNSIDAQLPGEYVNDVEGKMVNLPMGDNEMILIATDDSGNTSECTFNISVQDLTAPTPICDTETVIPLPQEGFVSVKAEIFDQASYDFCGIESFTVRRMVPSCDPDDINFGPNVTFCCEDIGQEVMVVLRVTDVNGNTNECMVSAEVQDKIAPALLAGLPDITVSCEFPITPDFPQIFGKVVSNIDDRDSIKITADLVTFDGDPLDAFVLDNCVEIMSDEIDTTQLNDCGLGGMERTIIIADAQGNDLVITQTITRVNVDPFLESDITWPAYYTATNTCSIDDLQPQDLPDSSAFPILANTNCDMVGILYDDSVFDFSNGDESCFKIRRTWTVANFCQDDYQGFAEEFSYEQIIIVANTMMPEISGSCTDIEECSYSSDCGPEYIELVNSAVDDCTDSINLIWEYNIDLFSDGSIDESGNTNNASGTYPLGLHIITWTVFDQCGGSSDCTYTFELMNCKQPIAYCLDNITADLTPMDLDGDGEVDTEMLFLAPYMIDAGSQPVCGGTVSLSFSSDVTDTIRSYDCDDIGENTVMLWVTDELGNQSFCTTSIEVQDNNSTDFCNTGTLDGGILGNISTSEEVDMEQVIVTINGIENTATSEDGEYAFEGLVYGDFYTVTPEKEDDPLNGITVADILTIQKHILGTQIMTDPYKILAADVNQSESVSGTDILIIRKLLLGHYDGFPETEPWKFYMDEGFIDESWPWANVLHESFEDNVYGETIVDFVGVKMGDVNQSGEVNGLHSGEIVTRSDVDFIIENQEIEAGESIRVPVVLGQAQNLNGFQWEISWDFEAAELVDVLTGFDQGELQFFADKENDILRVISYDAKTRGYNESAQLFTLLAEAKQTIELSEVIQESRNPRFANEWVSVETTYSINTEIKQREEELQFNFDIEQNVPNPWDEMTMITITSGYEGTAQLTILNSVGQVQYRSEITVREGENELVIYPQSLSGNGVYYYTIEMDGQTKMKKMILLR